MFSLDNLATRLKRYKRMRKLYLQGLRKKLSVKKEHVFSLMPCFFQFLCATVLSGTLHWQFHQAPAGAGPWLRQHELLYHRHGANAPPSICKNPR